MAACGVSKCGPAARAVGIAVVGLGAVEAGVADPAVGGAATGVVGARAGAVGAGAVEAGAVGAGGGTTLVGADTGGSGAFPPHPAAASMRAARAAAAVPGRRRAQSNMEGFIWSPVSDGNRWLPMACGWMTPAAHTRLLYRRKRCTIAHRTGLRR